MAIENLKSQLRQGMNTPGFYKLLTDELKVNKIHEVEIDVQKAAQLVKKAVIQAIRDYHRGDTAAAVAYLKQYNEAFNLDAFIFATNNVIGSFKLQKGMFGNTSGRYKGRMGRMFDGVVRDTLFGKPGFANFVIPINSLHFPAIDYLTFLKNFRDNVYRFWILERIDILRDQRFGKVSHASRERSGTGVNRPYKPGARGDKEFGVGVHDPITVPMAWIELKGHQIQSSISATITELDLVQRMIDGFDVVYEEHPDYDDGTGKLSTKRVVKVKLGPNNVDMYYDLKFIQNILDALTEAQLVIAWCPDALDPEKALEAIASPSFKQQAAAAAQYKILRDLMNKNRHHVVKKKIKTRKPKIKGRSVPLKKGRKSTKRKSFKATLAQRVRVQKGIEKGQGKEASTNMVADLARLKKYINSRLPAETRRNMGRPTLQNRTGRFSNSVQLLSLQQAKNSIMAKYTYLLSPYQTFENTGLRRWPLAYNPKPLIAKSIRNLAQGRIKQKLTVRRV